MLERKDVDELMDIFESWEEAIEAKITPLSDERLREITLQLDDGSAFSERICEIARAELVCRHLQHHQEEL